MLKIKNNTDPVWILSNPRVGSTYLMTMLNCSVYHKHIGNKELDYYQPIFSPHFREHFINMEKTPYHPYYNKIHAVQFLECVDYVVEDFLPEIKYIRIKRSDYESIAVSHYLARTLDEFVVFNGKHPDTSIVSYNEGCIEGLYRKSIEWDKIWDDYLIARESLDIEYEELVESPRDLVDKVMNYVGHQGDYSLSLKDNNHIVTKMFHPQKQEFVDRLRESHK